MPPPPSSAKVDKNFRNAIIFPFTKIISIFVRFPLGELLFFENGVGFSQKKPKFAWSE